MKNVEDIYPLSPMQQMMLLHASTQPGNDVLFNQVCFDLRGKLDEEAFIGAWRRLLTRHTGLRSLFLSDDLPRPMQVVRQEVELPVTTLDWRDHSVAEHPDLLAALYRDDRMLPFDTAQAPMMRITLVRCSSESHYLLWSSHHLVIDRWCTPVILRELAQDYRAALEGSPSGLKPAPPYRNYIRWIEHRDKEASAHFWRRLLVGIRGGNFLTERASGASDQEYCASAHASLSNLDKVRAFCQSNELTMATLVQSAWGLLINRYSFSQDVVFGVVSSGRPAEMPEVESILGSFITNLPVRSRLAADAGVIDWMQQLQQQARRRLPHEYVSLAQIRSWCAIPPANALFDSLVVWLAQDSTVEFPDLQAQIISQGIGTVHPLTLYVAETESGLSFTLETARGFRSVAPLAEILSHFCTGLLQLSGCGPHISLGSLADFRGTLGASELQSEHEADRLPRPLLTQTVTAETAHGRERPEQRLLEDLVAAQWRSVLGLDEIPVEADFFDLGGDSLMAASLVECLRAALRKDIPLLTLFRQPTVKAMAALILSEDWPVTAQVATAVKEAPGTLPPLFCVASPEVDTVGYAVLARHLSSERSVYVLQSPPTGGGVRRMRPTEVPQLAQDYIDAMREIQASGPYHLLGMCNGSQISLEICRKLDFQRESVAFSGVLDTWALNTLSRFIYLKKALDRASYYANRLRALRRRTGRNGAEQRGRGVVQKARADMASPESAVGASTEGSQRKFSLIEEVGRPGTLPDLPRFSGKITVFRQCNRQQYWRIRDGQLGWGLHADAVELVQLNAPGHKAIFREPWVRELALDLDARLTDN